MRRVFAEVKRYLRRRLRLFLNQCKIVPMTQERTLSRALLLAVGGLMSRPALAAMLCLLFPVLALAAPAEDISAPVLSAKSSTVDGQAELQSMLDRVRRMKEYCFDSALTTYIGNKPVVETGKLFFKSPNMIRFEVIKSASHSGAIVVRQSDGKIRGQMGGILRGIKVTLSPDSKLLRSANGFSLVESDLVSLLNGAEHKIKGDIKCLTVPSPSGHGEAVEIVEGDGDVVDRIAVDPKTKVPAEWNIYNGNRLSSTLTISNFQCSDLNDDLFTLGKDFATKALGDEDFAPSPNLTALRKDNGNKSLLSQSLTEIERATRRMRDISDDLSNDLPAKDGDWSRRGRAVYLTKLADLESLQYMLRPVGTALGKNEGGDSTAAPADTWNKGQADCEKAMEQFIAQLWSDKPDTQSIQSAQETMKTGLAQMSQITSALQESP